MATARPCCLRCAQWYVYYPFLECDPTFQDERRLKGMTHQVSSGCHNCRANHWKCVPVPAHLAPPLRALQAKADEFRAAGAAVQRIALREFRALREAQVVFTSASADALDASTKRGRKRKR